MPDEINQTWESASIAAPESTASVVDPPVVADPVVPPAETPTLETTEAPSLEVGAAPVRESESQEAVSPEKPKEEPAKADEYVVEADDPPEIQALTTPAAKKWAKRQFQDAKPVHLFTDYAKPIKEFGDELFKRSSTRYGEHVRDVITTDGGKFASQVLFGLSIEDVRARLEANAQPATTTKPSTEAIAPPISLPTEAELAEMTVEQAVQRFQQYTASQEQEKQKLQSAFETKIDDLRKQFDAVNGKITTKETEQRQTEIGAKQSELYNDVWSVVGEVVRNSGLEAQPNDPPKIAGLKEAARDLLSDHNVQAAFDAVEENGKLVKYVFEATNRGEFQNADRERDNLKVRARTAAESLKQTAKFKAILGEIEAYAAQSTAKSRAANPIPPAPGASAGVAVKPPSTWDEAVGGKSAAA